MTNDETMDETNEPEDTLEELAEDELVLPIDVPLTVDDLEIGQQLREQSPAVRRRLEAQLKRRGMLIMDPTTGQPALVLNPVPKGIDIPLPEDANIDEHIEHAFNGNPKSQEVVAKSIATYKRLNKQSYAGLSDQQRKFLLNRALCETDKAACTKAGVNYGTLMYWRRNNDVFNAAYAALWVDIADFTEGMLTTMLPKAADVLEDALESREMKHRLRATEIIFRSRGLLKPSGEEGANTYEQALARLLLERNTPLPPQLRNAIEGTYRTLPEPGQDLITPEQSETIP